MGKETGQVRMIMRMMMMTDNNDDNDDDDDDDGHPRCGCIDLPVWRKQMLRWAENN